MEYISEIKKDWPNSINIDCFGFSYAKVTTMSKTPVGIALQRSALIITCLETVMPWKAVSKIPTGPKLTT